MWVRLCHRHELRASKWKTWGYGKRIVCGCVCMYYILHEKRVDVCGRYMKSEFQIFRVFFYDEWATICACVFCKQCVCVRMHTAYRFSVEFSHIVLYYMHLLVRMFVFVCACECVRWIHTRQLTRQLFLFRPKMWPKWNRRSGSTKENWFKNWIKNNCRSINSRKQKKSEIKN